MAEMGAGEKAKKSGWDCWWPTCDKTVNDEPLVRTEPKGQPGQVHVRAARRAEASRTEQPMSALADLNRRAAVRITRSDIARILQLPDGVEVLAIDSSNDPVGFTVIVTGPDIPEVPEGSCAPYGVRYRTIDDYGDGRPFVETVTYEWVRP